MLAIFSLKNDSVFILALGTVNNEYINQKEMEAKREEALEFNQIKLETARGGYGEESV